MSTREISTADVKTAIKRMIPTARMSTAGQDISTEYYRLNTEETTSINMLQYADDSKIYLHENQITIFKQTMDSFARATGQHLNVEKTAIKIVRQHHVP